jgi:hypothetical protein
VPVATQVQLSTVAIDEPTPNETVGTSFPAYGTYSIDSKIGLGWVMWQVQPAGDPPSPTGWQPASPQEPVAAPRSEGWDGSDPGNISQAWSDLATSTTGSKTFYAAAFTARSPNPVAVGSVNITVS